MGFHLAVVGGLRLALRPAEVVTVLLVALHLAVVTVRPVLHQVAAMVLPVAAVMVLPVALRRLAVVGGLLQAVPALRLPALRPPVLRFPVRPTFRPVLRPVAVCPRATCLRACRRGAIPVTARPVALLPAVATVLPAALLPAVAMVLPVVAVALEVRRPATVLPVALRLAVATVLPLAALRAGVVRVASCRRQVVFRRPRPVGPARGPRRRRTASRGTRS